MCLRCFRSFLKGLPFWFFVFVSLVAEKLALGPNVIFVLLASYFRFPGWFSHVLSMPFKLACLVFTSSLIQCVVCPKAWFHTFGVAVSIFPGAFHSFQQGLPCLCPFCALCVFLWALVSKNYHLKLICFVSVALVVSILCSLCLLVGLGVKKLSS